MKKLRCRVARWHFLKPKIQIRVNFGGTFNGRCWYILWPFGIFYCHLVYFIVIRYIFPFLNQEKSGNPAPLVDPSLQRSAVRVTFGKESFSEPILHFLYFRTEDTNTKALEWAMNRKNTTRVNRKALIFGGKYAFFLQTNVIFL
jgi:hypothetical protein